MKLDELKDFVSANPHIKELWINEKGDFYLHNPHREDYEYVSRSEFLGEPEPKPKKEKKETKTQA